MATDSLTVRLLFVEDGAYHEETVELPRADFDQYERLIDWLREDPGVLKRLHVDVERLCSAALVEVG